MNKVKGIFLNLILVLLLLSFSGCTLYNEDGLNVNADTNEANNGFIPAKAGNYDSADTAVVVKINTAECKITFQTTAIGKKYTLYYDGATEFSDKYGTGMSVRQLNEGDLVDVTFVKMWKRLNSLKLSDGVFSFNSINDYQFSFDNKHVMIAGEQYTLDDNFAIVSDEGTLDLIDINPVDVLSFRGFDHIIYSIVIERSHGYIRLVNDSYFVGGWIEVSQRQIATIEEDMLLAVPVGNYDVTVSNQGSSGTKTVNILQGQEYELDCSGYETAAKFGDIIFVTNPGNARVYIDGEEVDTSEAVSIEYGIHRMIVVADNYQTISRYLKVGSESASLNIEMEKKEKGVSYNEPSEIASESENQILETPNEKDEFGETIVGPPVSGNGVVSYNIINPPSTPRTTSDYDPTASSNAVTSRDIYDTISTTANYKVFVDSPQGAEVYVDGVYVGIAPVGFAKNKGVVVVTLRKEGYENRSYTLNIDDTKQDINYSFSELTPLRTE